MAKPEAARQATLIEGDIRRALVSLGVPMSFGIVFILAVSLVDTYFVGRLGTDELAAISFTFPVVMVVTSATLGLGVGTTSAIARAIGAGDERRVRQLTTHALILALAVVAALSLLGLICQRWLFARLGAEGVLLEIVLEYMTIWFAGSAFLVVPMIGSGAMRATGDARTPMLIMMSGAIANGILDPMFIFGFGPIPAMGVRGAALATLASRVFTLSAALWVLGWRMKLLEFRVPRMSELIASWRAILSVGLPASLTNMFSPLAAGVLTALIADYGKAAVAAWGVGTRLEMLVLIAPLALGSAMTPFVGQNWGAEREDRVGRALVIARRFAIAWGLGGWLVLIAFGGWVATIFSSDAAVHDPLQRFFWIVPAGYAGVALVRVIGATFNAIDQALRATVISALQSLLLAVPLALLGGALWGLMGIFAGVAAASLLTGVIANGWAGSLFAGAKAEADAELVATEPSEPVANPNTTPRS
ncbi:MATE family efflux transporter [Pseudenhygromyxa sp. WMMC2535]|uniref:MATE family efflux transporter n=1 Tax=Pseudenhygromyxa sp. WMMC2535 TaxID=2712867 RepID=UPI001557DD56|nr:MATE family efflux transporter [Pseudenhygromyxa sp. WMMC2535]NVB39125.1 MATE family efflux transporter [Pseudenhygromyxa sp. WMMC2535]